MRAQEKYGMVIPDMWAAALGERVDLAGIVQVQLVEIGPHEAQEFLDKNAECQRKVTDGRVSAYAADMNAGRWALNGETLVVLITDKGETLQNGQHRMHAVIKSGARLLFLVVYVKENAFQTYDNGKIRSGADVLLTSGRSSSSFSGLAAAANLINRIERLSVGWRSYTLPKSQLVEFIESRPGLEESVKFSVSIFLPLRGMIPPAILAATHYFWSKADPARAVDLLDRRLSKGERDARGLQDPAWVLRERLARTHNGTGRLLTEDVLLLLLQRCWDLDVSGGKASNASFQVRNSVVVFLAGAEVTFATLFSATGLKQIELATKLGVHESTVSAWVTGDQRPAKEHVAKVKRIIEALAESKSET